MKLRTQLLLFLFLFGFAPLTAMVASSLPFVLDRLELLYHKAHLQNLRSDFRDLDEYLASRHELVRLLAKLPEPSLILSTEQVDDEAMDQARVRYTTWVNQILNGQLDIIQILFLDKQENPRFWLELNPRTQQWEPTLHKPDMPSSAFFKVGMQQEYGGVAVSKISLNAAAGQSDPRRFMTMRLISTILGRSNEPVPGPIGAVVVNIDVGGMARAYRNTLWVTSDGTYLQEKLTGEGEPLAFRDFAGLEEIFRAGNLALWEDGPGQVIWVPMFATEDSGPLWVGRAVDPSPVSQFRNNLLVRILTIACLVLVIVLVSARWISLRASRLSQSLAERIGRVLAEEQAVRFDWRGPREIQDLGQQLTSLAEKHARHAKVQREHALQLEESNRYKSEFLANVSHELRTPLNSILLLSKMLRESPEPLTDEQQQQLRVIHEAGKDLKGLIDNILDLSKIEAGRAEFHLECIHVQPLLAELTELVKPQFDAKGLELVVEIQEGTPEQFISDLPKVRQILKNFLSNAIKFTHQGKVVIRAYRHEERTEHPLCIEVEDSGIGIAADKHEVIFEAFKQADGSTSRLYGGTGLGLSISRELAFLLGGRIYLRSEPGKGACFTLCLPLEIEPAECDEIEEEMSEVDAGNTLLGLGGHESREAEPTAVSDAAEFNGERVLLVDDNLKNLLALTPLLESWGLEVTAAGDGQEAMETLEEDADFSIVLMDMMMPELDGYATIEKIRKEPRFDSLAVISLTADLSLETRERCLEAGADDFLIQPVDVEGLREIIHNHLP